MALVVYDRVQETTTTSGTGSVTLGGAVSSFQSFAVVGNGNTTFYCIVDAAGPGWEVGIGTYSTTGPTLARTTVLSNSNGNTTPITLSSSANTKYVFCTYPSEKSVNLDASGNVTALGTITSGVWNGTTIPVAYGGTGVTASSGANSVVLRDSNQNVTANNFLAGFASTVSAAGTTTLTASSAYLQRLTGTTTQTYKLPDATTLVKGQAFIFDNDSTGTLTIVDGASSTLDTIVSGSIDYVYCIDNSTVAGTWIAYGFLPSTYDFGTSTANFGTAILTNGTWNGNTVGTGYGGTGLTGFSAANNAIYSTSSSALTAGTLPVAAGGTGATSLTGYVYGNGTSAMTASTTIPTSALTGNYVSTFGGGTTGLTPASATAGAVTLGGTLAIANGGTNQTAYTAPISSIAGLVWYDGTSFQNDTNTAHVGYNPSTNTFYSNNINVSGTVTLSSALPVAQGGTGQTTASAAFNALSPITSTGDLIVGNGTNSATRLGVGTNGQVLTSNGTTATWATPSSGAGTITNTAFTATAGQTTFSVTYNVGLIEVFRNGVCLVPGTDYTATTGTTVVLATGANVGDSILVVAFSSLNIYSTFTTDTFSGNGSTTAFTMSVTPSSASATLVAISGVVQDPSTYTVAGTTLTFSAAPPSGTNNISVRYLGVPATGVVSSFQTSLSGLTPSTATTGAVTLGGVLGVSSGGTGATTSTGSGSVVLSTSPTITSPTISTSYTAPNITDQTGLGFKNRIINGAMMIDQRNAGASVTPTNGQYLVDRWQALLDQSSKYTAQQNAGAVTPPVGFTNYLGFTSSSSYSVGASERFGFRQVIEGFNVADLAWGTANAKSITVSFQVYSSLTGNFGGVVFNDAQNRFYPFSFTISSANTWTSCSVTIAGDTSGTWLTNNGGGLYLSFSLGTGSTRSGPAGSWSSTAYQSVTGAVSVVGTSGATFYITGVQLEKGTTATSFDYRPYGTELNLCYRYCFAMRTDALGYTQYGRVPPAWTTSTTQANFDLFLPIPMRNTAYSITYNNKQYEMYFITGGGSTGQQGSSMTLNTDANGINWVNIILTASSGTWTASQIAGFRFSNATDAALIISTEL